MLRFRVRVRVILRSFQMFKRVRSQNVSVNADLLLPILLDNHVTFEHSSPFGWGRQDRKNVPAPCMNVTSTLSLKNIRPQ